MGIVKNLFVRPSGRLALLSDLVMVGAAGAKLVRGRNRSGSAARSGRPVGPGEALLAAGAGLRLVRRLRRRRAARRLRRLATAAGEQP